MGIRTIWQRYADWLHLQWPAGTVEPLPVSGPDGETNIPGLRIAGDLTGMPLLKFASETGARAVRAFLREPGFAAAGPGGDTQVHDLVIVGAGVAGVSAALEARRAGLRFVLLEASEPFSTIAHFPRGKPIYTYPAEMEPSGGLRYGPGTEVKEGLLQELRRQQREAGVEAAPGRAERVERREGEFRVHLADPGTAPLRARRVLVAIGRSGDFRRLGVPGEVGGTVFNRLHDPQDFAGRDVLVVGGGDSALEAAAALAGAGARVTLSYRGDAFSRAKPENAGEVRRLAADPERPLRLALETEVVRIGPQRAVLRHGAGGAEEPVACDAVFVMTGREAPLDFFRRSGVRIAGEWRAAAWAGFLLFFLFCLGLYHWKAGWPVFREHGWFPYRAGGILRVFGEGAAAGVEQSRTLWHTLRVSLEDPSFYYSLAYCLLVVVFGFRRMRRRETPYVRRQTWTLMLVQCVPLFLFPYLILPLLGGAGVFEAGAGKWLADQLFPEVSYGHGREYWRAAGFILAWPLFVYNVFEREPLWLWLGISLVQTFVLIPWMVRRWGKGAYCGWICSCGALAETLGDAHRNKMPHGPRWNRLNLAGQIILGVACLLLLLRILGWLFPGSALEGAFWNFFQGFSIAGWRLTVFSYKWFVDLFLAGVLGLGCYFWFSGRVWCRFFCPLAALMHLYARFSRFRIFAEKSKCISCNVCTSVCHQGIDVMRFANQGRPMEDPQCVRCSACVEQCPTGVLAFGSLQPGGRIVLDRLEASPVRMREGASGQSAPSSPGDGDR